MKILSLFLPIAAFVAATAASQPEAANWPSWRGANGSGTATSGTYPVHLDKTNQLWQVELGGKGCSTPIVWEGRIIITGPVAGDDAVLAFDWNGKELWHTKIGRERAGKHRNGSGSNPSPVTDGSGVYVYYKSGNLAALDLDGRLRWKTNLQERYGKDTLYWDLGTSPVLTKRDVIAAVMHKGESYLAAFDKVTGELRWKVSRNYETPVENDHSYATPLVILHEGKEALVVWGGEHLTAHDAANGKIIWSAGDFNPTGKRNWVVVGSPVIAQGIVVVPYGRGSRLHGVQLGGGGDVTKSHRIWNREDTGLFVPTPAVWKNNVLLVRDRGEVEYIDPKTGKTIWIEAFPEHRAKYYSSPTIAGGKVYASREDGMFFVAQLEGGFKLLSEINLGERVIAAPVPVNGKILLRGEKHLMCFSQE